MGSNFLVHVRMFLFIVTMLFIPSLSVAPCQCIDKEQFAQKLEELYKAEEKQSEYDIAYQSMVDTIKWHEGFRSQPYYCLAHVKTVGYGHAIKKGDKFNYPITKEFADSLLKVDFDRAIDYVSRTTDLEYLQLLAVAHFVYALGSGNFSRSNIKEKIKLGEPIDDEIVKWVHIRKKDGTIIKSDHLLKSRRMELNYYNSET